MFHSFYRSQFLDERFQMPRIAHHDGQCSGEQSVMRVNADASQSNARFFGNDGSDVGHDTDIIMPYYTQVMGYCVPCDFPAQRAFTMR